MCGTEPYDPNFKACENGMLSEKCGENALGANQFCYKDEPYDFCNAPTCFKITDRGLVCDSEHPTPQNYNPETQVCEDLGNGKFDIYYKCAETTYNNKTHFCHEGKSYI